MSRLRTVDWQAMRERFYTPSGRIYLDGNSLGLLSKDAERTVTAAMEQWKAEGVQGWSLPDESAGGGGAGWLDLPERLAGRLAPLLGALPREVAICNQTTVNLHQLLATFFEPTAARNVLLCDDLAFPSDAYAMQSHLRLRGLPAANLRRVNTRGDGLLHEEDLIAAMTPAVHTALFPAVVYTTGQLLDLARLTEAAHARGIVIGFDLSHSAGSVQHGLHEIGADFAFGCTYKYLSAGPGATGFLFVHEKHLHREPGLAGWFGSDRSVMFDMASTFSPAPSATRFTIGTPPLLATVALAASLGLYEEAGMDAFRTRSLELTELLIELADEKLAGLGVTVATPREPGRRGGHVSLRHPQAKMLCAKLIERGVVPDFRNPDLIRLAPVPLYNNEDDCRTAVAILADLLRGPSC